MNSEVAATHQPRREEEEEKKSFFFLVVLRFLLLVRNRLSLALGVYIWSFFFLLLSFASLNLFRRRRSRSRFSLNCYCDCIVYFHYKVLFTIFVVFFSSSFRSLVTCIHSSSPHKPNDLDTKTKHTLNIFVSRIKYITKEKKINIEIVFRIFLLLIFLLMPSSTDSTI